MTKKESRYPTEKKYTYDIMGVMCVECPACEGWIGNVKVGQEIRCSNCQHAFKVIE